MTYCTGGTVTQVGNKRIHSFTTVGSATPLVVVTAGVVEYLVVAGGGAGGYASDRTGGGGGAGGVLYSAAYAVTAGSKTVTVGDGGVANTITSGGDSVFDTVTATGGGHGGYISGNAENGGSGGGTFHAPRTAGTGTAGPPRQGYDGGTGYDSGIVGQPFAAGGGGGASQAGANGLVGGAGKGGNGTAYTIRGTGSVIYGGGGGGGSQNVGAGAGGDGGGGAGSTGTGTSGTANTGGGGGGGGSGGYGGAGGTGIVVVSYVYVAPTANTLATGLISYYTLDQNSTTLTDSVGANNATANANVTLNQDGKINKCVSMNGSTSKITLANQANFAFERTQAFSVAAWIKASADGRLVCKEHSAVGWWFNIEYSGLLTFGLSNTWASNALQSKSTKTVTNGAWRHVVVTYPGDSNPSNVKFYIDGVVDSTVVGVNALSSTIVTTDVPGIGCRDQDTNTIFSGNIDEVGIWSKVLNASEVSALYNLGRGFSYPWASTKMPVFYPIYPHYI